jgi:hypothetical protein
MEQEIKNHPVGEPTNAGGVVENDEKNQDVVEYNSYKKALDEKKLFQNRLTETEKELQALREADLKRKGKVDELLSAKEKRIQELEQTLANTGKQYSWSVLTGEIKREAIKSGCKDPDKLIKLMGDDDLKKLSENIGENFEIASEPLKEVIEKNRKENYFLFSDSNKKIVNGNPSTKVEDEKVQDLSKLSIEELKELHKKTYK